MLIIKEIFIPRSSRANLTPVAIGDLTNSFETAIKEALFSFPYDLHKYQYVVRVQEDNGRDDSILIIDPELFPSKDQLFVCIVDNVPVVEKYDPAIHHEIKILGTVVQASNVPSINSELL